MNLSKLAAALGLSLFACASQAATITIVNADGANEGFNDPTVVTPVGSNPGATLGQQRLNVFQAAADQWAAVLDSAVPIRVNAKFDPQTCDANGAVLGSAGANTFFRSFANTPPAPYDETWFAVAEANALAGVDLDTDVGVAGDDIIMTFNVSIDAGCLPGTTGWWYDTGGVLAIPADRIALMPVVFHEIAHGLGFQTITNTANGALPGGNPRANRRPDIWTHFLTDLNLGGGTSWALIPNTVAGDNQRQASAIDDPFLVWAGSNVTDRAGGYLDPNPAAIINAPPGIAGTYEAQPASFGPLAPLGGLQGIVAEALDGTAPAADGCEAITNGGQIAGRIALVDRGTCNFNVKVANAQAVGAIGVLVANNAATGLPPMGGADPTIVIPSYGITQALGTSIRANLVTGVDATLGYDFASLAGMNGGLLRMYAPNPREPGSSVSHFSTAATPNLLMEPALNQELFNETDMTVPLFRDIFWPINEAAIANKAPTLNAASEFVVQLNTASPLTEILFGDIDAGTASISLRFEVDAGTLTLQPMAGVALSGSGTDDATISGSRLTLLSYVVGGNVLFTTALDDTSDVALTLTIDDNGNSGNGGALTATDAGTIVVNQPPVALDDTGMVAEGGTLNVAAPGVLTNDTDGNGDPLSAVLDAGPANASSFTLNADGSYSYTHDDSETTSDSFTYHANDGSGDSNVATVSITVTPVNDNAPVAVADAGTVAEGGTLNVLVAAGVLSNDTDADGSALTAVLDSGPANDAGFTLNADGSYSYTHDGSETTGDSFTYHANDGVADSNTVTVSITVTPVNDNAPVAAADVGTVAEGGTLNVAAVAGVLSNDTDADGSALTAVLDGGPANASSFTLNADGSYSYSHNGSETISDSFTYHANDGVADSNTVTVSITVTPVNDAPVVTAPIADQSDAENDVVSLDVSGNFADAESALSFSATGLPPGLSISAAGAITGTLTFDSAGNHSVDVTANDGNGGTVTDSFTWTVAATNRAPVISGEPYAFTVTEAAPASTPVGTVAAADPDSGDTLGYSITGGNTGGAFAIDANGAITVATPGALTAGAAFVLTVRVADGGGLEDTTTVDVSVQGGGQIDAIFYNGFEGS